VPSVLIVDDEPAAGRYLRSMIELRRPDFAVVGIAENGKDALEQVRLLGPDLVVTDVKMPVMDGIELVAELRREFPELPAIIVSGYQEFEYARRALDTGVVDYLLKPVSPQQLDAVLGRLGPVLARRGEARRAGALARLIRGDRSATAGPVSPGELFWLAVARVGGLPSRFRLDPPGDGEAARAGSLYALPGRDSRERIYLGAKEQLTSDDFSRQVAEAAGSAAAGSGIYGTLLIAPGAPRADELRKAVRDACLDLDRLIVPGRTQEHRGRGGRAPGPEWDKCLADRIEFALLGSRADLLERAIRDMVAAWEGAGTPLLSIESRLRRILDFVLRKAPRASEAVAANLEFLLEDALAEAGSYSDIADAAWSLVARAAGAEAGESAESADPGVPAFFGAILRYAEGRYSEPLTLGALSERFRISASYLSKLFRQHAGLSFGEYLSTIRIEAAKRLIRESPGMPLKDVAERVGFKDPFYFSRVFKSAAGLPPSDYSRLGREGPPACPE
jgi:two-component system, response regulator YesN